MAKKKQNKYTYKENGLGCSKFQKGESNKELASYKLEKMSHKYRFDLLPWDAIRQAAKVMAFGVGKHGIDVWKTEPIWHQQAAMMRHFSEYMEGNYYDKETGLPALAHCLCRLLFLIALEEDKREKTS